MTWTSYILDLQGTGAQTRKGVESGISNCAGRDIVGPE